MHETSLIEFTMNAVEKKANQMGIPKVGEIGLVVGKLSAVPHLLESAFKFMKNGRAMFSHSSLHIDYREISFQCLDCMSLFESQTYSQAACPECGSVNLKLTGGDELMIDYFIPYEDE